MLQCKYLVLKVPTDAVGMLDGMSHAKSPQDKLSISYGGCAATYLRVKLDARAECDHRAASGFLVDRMFHRARFGELEAQ